MIVVKVRTREVYGNELIYPDNEAAKTFAKIAGTKTLTTETIKNIQSLGIEVQRTVSAIQNFPVGGVTPGYGGKTFR